MLRRLTCMEELNKKAISPEDNASSLSWMVAWMEEESRWRVVAGEKTSMSRCRRSHQKGTEADGEGHDIVETTMA
jgi:hypothetical protein